MILLFLESSVLSDYIQELNFLFLGHCIVTAGNFSLLLCSFHGIPAWTVSYALLLLKLSVSSKIIGKYELTLNGSFTRRCFKYV